MASRFIIMLAVAAAFIPASTSAQSRPREVNVTTDSAPGWIPSEDQEKHALAAMSIYFDALDNGRFDSAYRALTEQMRASLPFAQFEANARNFRDVAGRLIERRVLKVTWTKDPAQAPVPGIYVAIDLSAHHEKVARECGYAVLYEASENAPFEVMRTENSFMSDADAAGMAPDAADRAWRAVAAGCPNYKP